MADVVSPTLLVYVLSIVPYIPTIRKFFALGSNSILVIEELSGLHLDGSYIVVSVSQYVLDQSVTTPV